MDVAALYADYAFWIWAALGAAILAVEVATGTGWLLWPAASAAVTALLSLILPRQPALEIGIFAVLTIVSTLAARRFWPGTPRVAPDINDNVARLIGHRGRVVEAFADGLGRVAIDGKEWPAEIDVGAPPPGATVEVTGVHGARLTVRTA